MPKQTADMMILLIEDDPFFAGLAAKLLAPATVVIARDGTEGLGLLERAAFDLAIVDLLMPVKDGLSTTVDLRKRDVKIPILAISAGGNIGAEGDLLRIALAIGATATLTKPFGRTELMAKVEECLSAREPVSA